MRTRLLLAVPLLAAPLLAGPAAAEPAATGPVLVRGDDPADALVGGVLAGRRGAPLLLVPPTSALPEATRELLERRAGTLTSVVVLGGEDAVAPSVLAEVLATR